MKAGRELEILPSLIMLEDGSLTEWERLGQEEKEEKEQKICERIQEKWGFYFAAEPEEWKHLF